MKIVRLTDSVPSPALVQDEVAPPRPGRGEMLIRVRAAGVTPTELSWYPTWHQKTGRLDLARCRATNFQGP